MSARGKAALQRPIEDWPKTMNSLVMSISKTAADITRSTGLVFTRDVDDLGEVCVSVVEVDGVLFGLLFRPPDPEGGTHVYVDDRSRFRREGTADLLAALGYEPGVVYWEENR